jgi:hypothetical protein
MYKGGVLRERRDLIESTHAGKRQDKNKLCLQLIHKQAIQGPVYVLYTRASIYHVHITRMAELRLVIHSYLLGKKIFTSILT